MDSFRPLSDQRLLSRCVYCGAVAIETRDHVPSRVLLDEPYPANLPVVPACGPCNNGFSSDEEYVACLVDCALHGGAEPVGRMRTKVSRVLRSKPALAARLASERTTSDRGVAFEVDEGRLRNVVMKLARGHAAYELSSPHAEEPSIWGAIPLNVLTPNQREAFETPPPGDIVPEIGSRAMQRFAVLRGLWQYDWLVVQPGRYRYLAATTRASDIVRFVLSEFLACEVVWKA